MLNFVADLLIYGVFRYNILIYDAVNRNWINISGYILSIAKQQL